MEKSEAEVVFTQRSDEGVLGQRRPAEDTDPSAQPAPTRPRLVTGSTPHHQRQHEAKSSSLGRLKGSVQDMNEAYVSLASDMLYPKVAYGPWGYKHDKRQFPFDRVTALGYLTCPLRKVTVMEKWSPYEICVFEASIILYGKNFNAIQKQIQSKTVKEIIEFYYDWKRTSHYQEWKKTYIEDKRDLL